MFLLYDIIILIFVIGYLPVFFVKLQQAEDRSRLISDRLGFLSQGLLSFVKDKRVIWLHAVSVGETMAVRSFISDLKEIFPEHVICLSTVTPTGNKVATQMIDDRVSVFYFPIDISFIVRRVLSLIKPELLILMETELWPNLIGAAHKKGVKVAVVNGRLSPKSFRNYYKVSPLIGGVLRKVDLFLVQTRQYAKRLKHIGVNEDRIHVTGNMKFDNLADAEYDCEVAHNMKRELGFNSDDLILIGASTHSNEEEILIDAYVDLKKRFPRLKLLLVPRHIERAEEILSLAEKRSLSYKTASSEHVSASFLEKQTDLNFDVYLLNTIGQLRKMYALTDIVFMGGSLIKHGGQNPLEAIVYGKPVIVGDYTFNFPDIYKQLENLSAVRRVKSDEIANAVADLFNDSLKVREMTSAASKWLSEQKGAGAENCKYLRNLLA